jgi:hypothetical protein
MDVEVQGTDAGYPLGPKQLVGLKNPCDIVLKIGMQCGQSGAPIPHRIEVT